MTLQQLKYIITIAECGTISGAASRLYVNGRFDTKKSVETTEKGAKIGLSEVKSTLNSPFLTIF